MPKEPHVEYYKDRAGKVRYRLRAPNGKIIGPTESFSSMRKARADFAALVKYAPRAVEA